MWIWCNTSSLSLLLLYACSLVLFAFIHQMNSWIRATLFFPSAYVVCAFWIYYHYCCCRWGSVHSLDFNMLLFWYNKKKIFTKHFWWSDIWHTHLKITTSHKKVITCRYITVVILGFQRRKEDQSAHHFVTRIFWT